MRNKDSITGIVLAAFSVIYLYLSQGIKVFTGPGRDPLSAKFVPVLFGALLLMCACLLIIRGVRDAKKQSGQERTKGSFARAVRDNLEVILTFATLAVYLMIMKPVGFLLSSVLFIVAEAIILTPPEKRKDKKTILLALVIAIVMSVLADYVFADIFHVMLPEGILGF